MICALYFKSCKIALCEEQSKMFCFDIQPSSPGHVYESSGDVWFMNESFHLFSESFDLVNKTGLNDSQICVQQT